MKGVIVVRQAREEITIDGRRPANWGCTQARGNRAVPCVGGAGKGGIIAPNRDAGLATRLARAAYLLAAFCCDPPAALPGPREGRPPVAHSARSQPEPTRAGCRSRLEAAAQRKAECGRAEGAEGSAGPGRACRVGLLRTCVRRRCGERMWRRHGRRRARDIRVCFRPDRAEPAKSKTGRDRRRAVQCAPPPAMHRLIEFDGDCLWSTHCPLVRFLSSYCTRRSG